MTSHLCSLQVGGQRFNWTLLASATVSSTSVSVPVLACPWLPYPQGQALPTGGASPDCPRPLFLHPQLQTGVSLSCTLVSLDFFPRDLAAGHLSKAA